MTKFNQLNRIQRDIIQNLISKNISFTKIGEAIGKDRTTISKEIKRNRYIKCESRQFDTTIIQNAVNHCPRLQRPPYICNSCPNLRHCLKGKIYYNAKTAQEHYEDTLREARTGIDIDYQTIDEIEHSIVPLIKNQNQSVNQVYANHSDIIYFSKPTFYKYVNIGVFSLTNLDLPKKVKYKKRKGLNKSKRELSLLKGRKYTDFCEFIAFHPNMHIFEMDTVIGTLTSSKVLLTLYFRDTHFMIIRLLDKKNIECVNHEIENLKSLLGIKLYSKIFRIGLTDNGSEFFDPYIFEFDYISKKHIANLFYCDPQNPNQKAGIEKNHEYIRMVFPKGTSFDDLNKEQIKLLEMHINNIPRMSLNNQTPYQLTKEKFPEFIKKLNYQEIHPDEVNLTYEFIKGGVLNDRL